MVCIRRFAFTLSVLFFVGFLPVVVVGFEHEGVAASEHHVAQPEHEDCEGQQEPELPEGACEDHYENRDCEQPQKCLVSI